MLMSALAGANMIYGLGMIDLGMTLDCAQLVVDNELARMVRKVLEGIPVCDETMAVDIIRSVGAGGHFLSAPHTRKHMRAAQSHAILLDRSPYGKWDKNGRSDLAGRALLETRRILETHKPTPLSQTVSDSLRKIIMDTVDEWGVTLDKPLW
jgi:trimethylamine--corrinoid protein Co-methyltransferase